jgi:phosphotriesterase-related protein
MNRRDFLKTLPPFTTAIALSSCGATAGAYATPQVMTVLGPILALELGRTLPHEHLIADVRPYAEQLRNPSHPDPAEVLEVVLPHLVELTRLGCRSLIESTAVGLGRSPAMLKRLAEESGLHILTVTGNYAAAEEQFLPPYVATDTAEALAARWIGEWRDGIEGTGIRPGFIKLAFQGGPLTEIERKLIRAAAIAHLETGMAIGAHTTTAASAFEQLEALEVAGVAPSAWIWIHAQAEEDLSQQTRAARRGAWVSFDGLGGDSVEAHVDMVMHLRREGLLHRVLVSHDAGWYTIAEPRGGEFRSFDTAFTEFGPALRAAGATDRDIDQIFIENPSRAYALGVRAVNR